MFKYVRFNKVETEYTVLSFRQLNENVKVNYFNVDVVSIEGDNEIDIDALVDAQDSMIACELLTYDDFKIMVSSSFQIERIRAVIKELISKEYDLSDEIAMLKLDNNDDKKKKYDSYILDCLNHGRLLKSSIGY